MARMARATPIPAVAAALLLLLLLSPLLLAAEQPSCQLVASQLGPCLPYVLRTTLMPADMCCDGVVYLGSRYSEDQEARQAICECVKSSVSPILPIDFGLVNTLPQACGVSISLPRISFNVDCSKSSLMVCFLVSSATGKSPSTGLCQRNKQASNNGVDEPKEK